MPPHDVDRFVDLLTDSREAAPNGDPRIKVLSLLSADLKFDGGRPKTVVVYLQVDDEARDLIAHPGDVRVDALLPRSNERSDGEDPGPSRGADYGHFISGYSLSPELSWGARLVSARALAQRI